MKLISKNNLKKIFRFIKIYGLTRTIAKVFGRARIHFPFWILLSFPNYFKKGKKVGLIGCGHHAFSSIAYFLASSTNSNLVWVGDINEDASSSLAYCYGSKSVGNQCSDSRNMEAVDIVYIASNHYSHADYAIEYLQNGCDVFIEKPVAVNRDQLERLKTVMKNSSNKIFVGFNRPHSPAIKLIKEFTKNNEEPITLSCFIIGHYLPSDHWYRDTKEGTRIISNIAHWIDLAVHIFSWRIDYPEYIDITISYSDKDNPSENINIAITSPKGDLINLLFSCRDEPFEGVSESISFQQDTVIAKINDFRDIQIWKDSEYFQKKYKPKDNGHKSTILQPFHSNSMRSWDEIIESTNIMLHIDEMVKSLSISSRYTFNNNE